MIEVPTKITMLVDKQEKIPLLFPRWVTFHPDRTHKGRLVKVETKGKCMLAGDYAIEGEESNTIIERKGSLRELHQNLMTKDWSRAVKAFAKLNAQHNYLLLDMTPADMFRKSKEVPEPHKVFDRLCQVVVRFQLNLWWAGNCKPTKARRMLGEQVVRLLMTHSYSY